ncbi:MAG TPA: hypothetical protein VMS55_24740 [Myxococcota bacterium]|nr:hypothetical protein [Myxococcota bacterium]
MLGEIIANSDPGAGIVWVYQKPGTGWASTGAQAAILSVEASTEEPCGLTDPNPPDCSLSNNFTSSVAINGDGSTIVLGYNGAVVNNESRGAVYVFVRPGTGWVDNANGVKLTRSGGAHLDLLGTAVDIRSDDSTIVTSAPQANSLSGAVDVFVKSGSWVSTTQNAELTYAAGGGLLGLGNSVGITSNGSTVVAGGNGRALIFPEPTIRICTPLCHFITHWADRKKSAQLTATDANPIAWPRISGDGEFVAAAGANTQFAQGMLYVFPQPANGGRTASVLSRPPPAPWMTCSASRRSRVRRRSA